MPNETFLSKLYKRLFPPQDEGKKNYIVRNGVSGYTGTLYQDTTAAQAAIISSVIYTCLETRVQALAGLGWRIRKRSGVTPSDEDEIIASSEDIIPRHALAMAFWRFRLRHNSDFFALWYYNRLVTGKHFIVPIRDGEDYTDIDWYSPLDMTIFAPRGRVEYFQYVGTDGALLFEPLIRQGNILTQYPTSYSGQRFAGKMLYDHIFNLVDENEGVSPIETILDSVRIEEAAKRAILAYFRNGMKIGAIITPKAGGIFTEEQVIRLIQEMREGNSGADNAGKNLFLPYEADITFPSSGQSGGAASSEEPVRQSEKDSIYEAMRVPKMLTGNFDEIRYKADVREMVEAWLQLVILPDAHNIRDLVNLALMPLFDPDNQTYFEFDEDFVQNTVTRAEIDQQSLAARDLELGAITLAQYNQKRGHVMSDSEYAELDVRFIRRDALIVPAGDLQSAIVSVNFAPQDAAQIVESQQRTENTQEAQEAELRAWRRFVQSGKKRDFQVKHLRGDVEHLIREGLAGGGDAKSVFDAALKRLRNKAIQATRIDFEDTLEDTINGALAGDIDRRRFGVIVRALIERYGRMAYIDGLVDGGVAGAELDDDDTSEIRQMAQDQSAYVTNFADEVYQEGITPAQVAGRPAMWFNKSIMPFYEAGKLSADRNGYYEWVYGDTEHCPDCLALNGQIHRLRDYHKSGWLPQADKLACKGFNCKCNLVRVEDGRRASGRFPKNKHVHTPDCTH